MVFYLARKYYAAALVIGAGILLAQSFAGTAFRAALPLSLFIGGLGAAGLVYWRFERLHRWPLFDNLRLPRIVLLGVFFAGLQLVNFFITLWL
jgi:hypothetical protein